MREHKSYTETRGPENREYLLFNPIQYIHVYSNKILIEIVLKRNNLAHRLSWSMHNKNFFNTL